MPFLRSLDTLLLIGKAPSRLCFQARMCHGEWKNVALLLTTALLNCFRTSDAYDSKDFNLNAAGTTEAQIQTALTKMATTLNTYAANPGPKGVITLQHDLYNVTIDFAKRLFPAITQSSQKLKPMTVAQCLGDATPYQNGAGNTPTPSTTGGTGGTKTTGASSSTSKPSSASGLSVSSSLMMGALALLGTVLATL